MSLHSIRCQQLYYLFETHKMRLKKKNIFRISHLENISVFARKARAVGKYFLLFLSGKIDVLLSVLPSLKADCLQKGSRSEYCLNYLW